MTLDAPALRHLAAIAHDAATRGKGGYPDASLTLLSKHLLDEADSLEQPTVPADSATNGPWRVSVERDRDGEYVQVMYRDRKLRAAAALECHPDELAPLADAIATLNAGQYEPSDAEIRAVVAAVYGPHEPREWERDNARDALVAAHQARTA